MINFIAVILCGGSGARLWHLSRAGFPKQFLSLVGNEGLFQQATQGLIGLSAVDLAQAKQHALLKANSYKVNVSVE